MRFIDLTTWRRARQMAMVAVAAWLGGCAQSPPPPALPAPPAPAAPPASVSGPAGTSTAPPRQAPRVALAAPTASRSWDEFKLQAARRLVAANPSGSYTGAVSEPLLAIPVLEIELERDGSVRRIQVLRYPTQAKDTTQLAIDAVHRAAPFGDVSGLPRPWKFAEVFLFDEDRRFKPRTLD